MSRIPQRSYGSNNTLYLVYFQIVDLNAPLDGNIYMAEIFFPVVAVI